jgi:hypothetical protein
MSARSIIGILRFILYSSVAITGRRSLLNYFKTQLSFKAGNYWRLEDYIPLKITTNLKDRKNQEIVGLGRSFPKSFPFFVRLKSRTKMVTRG